MKKLHFSLLLFFLIIISGTSQNPMIEWQRSYGGSQSDGSIYMETTNDGGYIFVSYCESDDGDVSGINRGLDDYWIVKTGTYGAIQWNKTFGGSEYDWPHFVKQTNDGGYIVAGCSNSADMDLYDCNHGGLHAWIWDYWIIKLNSNGDFDWSHCYGGHAEDKAYSLLQTPDNGYLIAGSAKSDDGDVTGHIGNYDYWIVKTTPDGQIEWEKSYGGSQWDGWNMKILATSDGGYIVGGSSESSDGDVTGNWGDFDIWIVKLTSDGDITWQKNYGGYGWDRFMSMVLSPDGGYVIAGTTESHNSGDVGKNHGGFDAWVFKTSPDGNLVWKSCLGGSGNDGFTGIVVDNDTNYILSGYTESNNFNVSGNHGDYDNWLVKLAPTGYLLNQVCLGGSGADWCWNIHTTDDHGYVVSGSSNSNDGNVTGNHGDNDVWVVKLREFGKPDNWGNGIWLDPDFWVQQMTVVEFETIFQEISSHNIKHVYLNLGYFDNTVDEFYDAGDILSGANFQFVKDIIEKAHEYDLLLIAGVGDGDESNGGLEGGMVNILNDNLFGNIIGQCVDILDFYNFDGLQINFDPLPSKYHNQQVYDKFLALLDEIKHGLSANKILSVVTPKFGSADLWWWDEESFVGLFENLNDCFGQVVPKEYYYGVSENDYIEFVGNTASVLVNDLVEPYPEIRINLGLPCFPDDGVLHDDDIENLCNGLAGLWGVEITNWKNFEGISVYRFEYLHDGSQVCGWDIFDRFGNDIGNNFTTAKYLKDFTGNNTEESTIDYEGDSDFTTFTLTPLSRGVVLNIKLDNIPADRNYDLFLYNSAKSLIKNSTNNGNQQEEIELSEPYGTYYVEVRGISGFDLEHAYRLTFTKSLGIIDIKEKTPFVIFPNPNQGNFYVHSDQHYENLEFKVYNVSGKAVYQKQLKNTSYSNYYNLVIPGLPNGLYFIEISDGKKCWHSKLLIN